MRPSRQIFSGVTMATKSSKRFAKLRRYGIAIVAAIAGVGGVAGNLGSIVDLWDKVTGSSASVSGEALPSVDIGGTWQGEVTYDWGDTYTETFVFRLEAGEVIGTASFLQAKRGILDGKMSGDKLTFVTRTQERLGDEPWKEVEHRYRGIVSQDEIRFILQTVGGYSSHVPVEFVAKRVSK